MTLLLEVPPMLLFVIVTTLAMVDAEQQFHNLDFDRELCKTLGYDREFEVCAQIEFCHGSVRRRLQSNFGGQWDDHHDEEFMEYVETDENKQSQVKKEAVHDPMDVYGIPEGQEEYGDDDNGEDCENNLDVYGTSMDQAEYDEEDDQGYEIDDDSADAGHLDDDHDDDDAMSTIGFGWRIPGGSCTSPGPVMRLKRGLKHGLFVKGGVQPTNIHFHGLHISGHGNGDDLRRRVQGDDVLIYSIDLPANQHMGGTHWYHSHLEGHAWEQVKGGAFGLIVVDENGHDFGTDDEDVLAFLENERLLVLDNRDDNWKANGRMDGFPETYRFVQNEWYRLRVLVVSVDSYIAVARVVFGEGCEVRSIAHDGIMKFHVPSAEPKSEFVLTGASRLDVAIRCHEDAEISLDQDPFSAAAQIIVDDSVSPSSISPFESGDQQWQSSRLQYIEDLRGKEVDNYWTIKVDETNINGLNAGSHEPLCDENGNDFRYESIQQWTVDGADTHPLHVHMFPMQIISEGCGEAHEVGEFYDTIVTEGAEEDQRCLVRLAMVDVAGPTTIHCHIFEHAQHGAIGYLNVEGGPQQPNEPNFQFCKSGTCDGVQEMPKCSK